MTDVEFIANLIESIGRDGIDLEQPHGLELGAIGFPDEVSARVFATDCEAQSLTALVRRGSLLSDAQWEELLEEVGICEEEAPSREELRGWTVDAAANLVLRPDTIGATWDCLAKRAKELGGHLCSISFPKNAKVRRGTAP
ncbi:hypothetical protein [Sphingosinicella sp. BN140058]|uniref:hypothetical protein n=1 Tax=Sphingosinicella sp. BN140058 TaxID=1892855 RepID=UPI0010109416|nr:hypothetical protein [Sphingosinicella sp. BN140058]QAY79170.1 hypothetical protein ETR14_23510 [Sphingosinicella sp. BN140058]